MRACGGSVGGYDGVVGNASRLRTGFTTPRKRKFDNERLSVPASPRGLTAAPLGPPSRAASAACTALLAAEVLGTAFMWALIPLVWMWIGARVNDATNSLAAGGGVTFLGFVATIMLAAAALARLDRLWVILRRRAGHDQTQGALSQVMIVSTAVGLLLFVIWFYFLSKAFILPFMPSR